MKKAIITGIITGVLCLMLGAFYGWYFTIRTLCIDYVDANEGIVLVGDLSGNCWAYMYEVGE